MAELGAKAALDPGDDHVGAPKEQTDIAAELQQYQCARHFCPIIRALPAIPARLLRSHRPGGRWSGRGCLCAAAIPRSRRTRHRRFTSCRCLVVPQRGDYQGTAPEQRAEGIHRSRISGRSVPDGQSGCIRKPANNTIMPCHRALGEALRAYEAAGIAADRRGWLSRTARGRNGSALFNTHGSAGCLAQGPSACGRRRPRSADQKPPLAGSRLSANRQKTRYRIAGTISSHGRKLSRGQIEHQRSTFAS